MSIKAYFVGSNYFWLYFSLRHQ